MSEYKVNYILFNKYMDKKFNKQFYFRVYVELENFARVLLFAAGFS